MKKAIVLLVLLSSMAGLQAQTLKFGLKAGANFANLESNNVEGSTYTSFHFGALMEVKLLENLSLQPELVYSSQGTKVNEAAFDDINYNYITVPVLDKFFLTKNKLRFADRQQFSFILNENVQEQFEGETFDFGLSSGLGY